MPGRAFRTASYRMRSRFRRPDSGRSRNDGGRSPARDRPGHRRGARRSGDGSQRSRRRRGGPASARRRQFSMIPPLLPHDSPVHLGCGDSYRPEPSSSTGPAARPRPRDQTTWDVYAIPLGRGPNALAQSRHAKGVTRATCGNTGASYASPSDEDAMIGIQSRSIRLFSTCPPSAQYQDGSAYLRKVKEVAEWSDDASLEGILVYTDNSLADPWQVSQVILSCTSNLAPLVALQPVYMHPYTAAKIVSTFSYLYDRRIFLNMVAGGFRNDLIALGDCIEHDDRYGRIVEYVSIMRSLFEEPAPLTFTGDYYAVKNLALKPRIPSELIPEVFVSGTSAAGVLAARRIGATSISYPGTPSGETKSKGLPAGIRIGIIAREESREAWRVAHERFPIDRKGQLTHAMARRVSDSAWYEQLSELGESPAVATSPYWLVPFSNYKTFCPYLVGSYYEVRCEVSKYIREGFRTFILDVPPNREELHHTAMVFDGD